MLAILVAPESIILVFVIAVIAAIVCLIIVAKKKIDYSGLDMNEKKIKLPWYIFLEGLAVILLLAGAILFIAEITGGERPPFYGGRFHDDNAYGATANAIEQMMAHPGHHSGVIGALMWVLAGLLYILMQLKRIEFVMRAAAGFTQEKGLIVEPQDLMIPDPVEPSMAHAAGNAIRKAIAPRQAGHGFQVLPPGSVPIPDGPGKFKIFGKDLGTGLDKSWVVDAQNEAHARSKGQAQEIVIDKIERC